jgi:hypothetical protein
MKLFTKGIDKKLFAQYPKGGSLEGQKVIAKIFNPYGRGRWYIMNSDPDEPDYLWGIVELFQGEPEVGSFSREELENIKVGAFKLPLERDLYFDETDAMEVYKGLKSGKTFEHGGEMDDEGVDLFEDYEDQPEEVSEILSKYELEDNDYDILEQLLGELEEVGYTFEYGLDGEPYDLRKIGQRGKSEFYAKGGKLDYTSKRNIANVTIKYEGKEYLVSGDDVITGAYKFAKGGLSDTHIYIPKRDVIKVTTKDGESINSPLNGVWVKKEYFERNESKGSGSYEPSQATKVFAYKLTELKKDKEITASMKDSMVESLSLVDDFVNDLKYEIENNISGLAIETYANAVKSVSKKNKLRVAKNLAFYGNPNVLNLFPESFTKTPLLTKKAISMKGNILNNTAFLSELGKFTSDDALRPAMTAIRFDGKSVVATDANVLVHIYQDVSVEPQNLCVTKICENGGEDAIFPDWKSIITKNLNDSKFKNQTFDLDKLIVLVNWINNYYSVWDNYVRNVAVTTKDGDIAFNPENLLKVLTMLKVMGVKKPIMYYESGNRAVYFGEEGKLSGDPTYDNFILCMPFLSSYTKAFSLDVKTNEYKVVSPNYEYAKGGEMVDGKQLSIFA